MFSAQSEHVHRLAAEWNATGEQKKLKIKTDNFDNEAHLILLNMSDYWGKGYFLLTINYCMGGLSLNMRDIDDIRILQWKKLSLKLNDLFSNFNLLTPGFVWKNCGVILCCSLDILVGSPLYKIFTTFLGPGARDLCEELKVDEPTRDMNNRFLSAQSQDKFGRTDYIWAIDKFADRDFLPLKCLSLSVIKQNVSEEFSDHWGLLCKLEPNVTI